MARRQRGLGVWVRLARCAAAVSSRTGRRRFVGTFFVTATVAIIAVVASLETLHTGSSRQLACRVGSNRTVPLLAARSASCPLRAYDRILAIEEKGSPRFILSHQELIDHLPRDEDTASLRIRRRGSEYSIAVPINTQTRGEQVGRLAAGLLLAAVLVSVALLILWNARTDAGVPLLLLCSCVSVLLIVALAARDAPFLEASGSIALGFLPATLTHLALTFPAERHVLALAPRVLWLPYGIASMLTLVSIATQSRAPTAWATADRLMIALSGIGAAFVIAGAWLAARQARSPAERVRARIFLYGMLGVVGIPTVIVVAFQGAVPGGSATLLGLGVLLFPLPIGYAISRYQLFDVGLDVQRALARLLAPTVLALLLTLGAVVVDATNVIQLPAREPVALFGVLYAILLLCEVMRTPLWSAADAWASRRLESLRRLRDQHARAMEELRSLEDIGRILGRTIEAALQASWVWIYGGPPGDWRLLYADRDGPDGSAPPARFVEHCPGRDGELVLHASHETCEETRGIPSAVEIVARLRSGDEDLGAAWIGPAAAGHPYTSLHVDFVRSVCIATAAAIHNANLTQDLMAAERFAAVGRLGAGLAHEIAKPLGLLERLAMRLPGRLENRSRTERDAARIFDLARELRTIVRGILAPPGATLEGERGLDVRDLLERAIQVAQRRCPDSRFLLPPQPLLPRMAGTGERMIHAVANLLENAALAGEPGDPVELVAGAEGENLHIEVLDRGSGMSPAVAERAFDPFFSTRSGEGTGLGLSFARGVVEERGGRIEIESVVGRGTRVVVTIPIRTPQEAGGMR